MHLGIAAFWLSRLVADSRVVHAVPDVAAQDLADLRIVGRAVDRDQHTATCQVLTVIGGALNADAVRLQGFVRITRSCTSNCTYGQRPRDGRSRDRPSCNEKFNAWYNQRKITRTCTLGGVPFRRLSTLDVQLR